MRGLLELEHDEKSGGYLVRPVSPALELAD